jgi:hypothetical protein
MVTAGIHPGIPINAYHAETGWIGSSQLKSFLPEHFRPFNGSPSADIGSVLHQRFTGDDQPVVPVDAATWQGKAAIEQQAAITASGGLPILTRDLAAVDGMEAALRAHSVAAGLLVDQSGAWELSVFAEVDGVPSKARFDRLLDDGTAVDIKTTKEGPGEYALTKAILSLGYDLQREHYEQVARAAGIELESFKFLFVQSAPPFHVTVVELDDAFRERAAILRDLALERFLHKGMVDSYPGERGTLTLNLPRWAEL